MYIKLNIKAFALTWGILYGILLFLTPWLTMFFRGYSGEFFLGRLYRGYTISPLGSIIGLLWGLGDGIASGAIVAWLYNFFSAASAQRDELPKCSK